MKKIFLVLALMLVVAMPAMARPVDETVCCLEATPVDIPTITPTPVAKGGGGTLLGLTPTIAWVNKVGDTYSFLSTQFGFAYLEDELGNRTYGEPAIYHTITGKGTLYFVQVDKNSYTWNPILVK